MENASCQAGPAASGSGRWRSCARCSGVGWRQLRSESEFPVLRDLSLNFLCFLRSESEFPVLRDAAAWVGGRYALSLNFSGSSLCFRDLRDLWDLCL